VTQWQLVGNWAGNKPMDVVVERILLIGDGESPELASLRKEDSNRIAAEKKAVDDAITAARAAVTHTPQSPWIERVYTIAPDVLAIAIRSQEVVPGTSSPTNLSRATNCAEMARTASR